MTNGKKGFAAMDKSVLAEISRKGGKAAHAAGTAYEFDSESARLAGRKGGVAVHAKRKREKLEEEAAPRPQVPRGTV